MTAKTEHPKKAPTDSMTSGGTWQDYGGPILLQQAALRLCSGQAVSLQLHKVQSSKFKVPSFLINLRRIFKL
jgi:hypothetical protein